MGKFKEVTVVSEGGEIISHEKVYTTKIENYDNFCLMSTNAEDVLLQLNGAELKVLIRLTSIMEYNTNKVVLAAGVRKEICAKLGIENTTLSRSLRKLKDVGLIEGTDGVFMINPAYYWKGEAKERKRILEERAMPRTPFNQREQ